MSVFKCKMCGAPLNVEEGAKTVQCEYCESQQTLPKLDDDKRANLYERANHFRRNNEFDKAMGIYEKILEEDKTDAESYWSLVLCRFGIEYVKDPATGKMIPTVNRTQYTSIFHDADYRTALKYADAAQTQLYQAEARAINEIQKGILEISNKEEPFDVFICYKETDANGRRTPDSVLATDLYHQLTNEGFKVFFARITLEDKLGTAYEPYIFAALNSAKVMVVLGTRSEYFNAVWVKNEWNRYLSLIKKGENKILIPAYRDMDPYDLPEEFSHLQSQDMSKLGFMQDLIRGIKKITQKDEAKTIVKETVISDAPANTNTAPLLKRAFMFLEDGDFARADEFGEQILNIDPENAQGYLVKLMAEQKAKTKEDLKNCEQPFDKSNNYQKAVRFGDEELVSFLEGIVIYICQRNENARLEEIYQRACCILASSEKEKELLKAVKDFGTIKNYKDSAEKIKECESKIEGVVFKKEEKRKEKAIKVKRYKKIAKNVVVSILVIVVLAYVAFEIVIPSIKYNNAVSLMEQGEYEEALEAFSSIKDYKDADQKSEFLVQKINDKMAETRVKSLKHALENCRVGDVVKLGGYEQDNYASNGIEDIKWEILEISDGKALLISKYVLECKKYNETYTEVTWETCTLRAWLNDTFYSIAFGSVEKEFIQTVTIPNEDNAYFGTDNGNDTTDKVFLLSAEEALRYYAPDKMDKLYSNYYIHTDGALQCPATAYAKAQGVYVESYSECSDWWLRASGSGNNQASTVGESGMLSQWGSFMDSDYIGVRPALWINLES